MGSRSNGKPNWAIESGWLSSIEYRLAVDEHRRECRKWVNNVLTLIAKPSRITKSGVVCRGTGPLPNPIETGPAMSEHIHRTVEFKLYLNASQCAIVNSWLHTCCWLYNRALEQRTKAYKRRDESVSYNQQSMLLTLWRERMKLVRSVPVMFARDTIRRVDRGMKAFFRRVRTGEKPGFPRFRSHRRYNSMECLATGRYIGTNKIRIPGIGSVSARGHFGVEGTQRAIRIIRRASGWYAQIVIESPSPVHLAPTDSEVGIDLGLESFLTTDEGDHVGNPRILRTAAKKLRRTQHRLSKCRRGSGRRKKAVNRVARMHEKVARKRRGFAHRTARELVNRFGRIAVEDLNVKGLARSRLSKSVNDVGWGIFLLILCVKAASAGREVVKVPPAGTSQECPDCGAIRKKELSEREHSCPCGLRCHRDHAAARVIRQRAFRPVRGEPLRPPAMAAGSMNRIGSTHC